MGLRTYCSWLKNFGLLNTVWIKNHIAFENQYSDFTLDNKYLVDTISAKIREQYDLKCASGITVDEKLYEYTALELLRQELGEYPDIIYFDERCKDGSFRYKPDFAPETNETFDIIGGAFLQKRDGDRYGNYFHVPRALVYGSDPVAGPGSEELEAVKKRCAVIDEEPLVSILIPNKDSINILSRCIDSIKEKTTYSNYEIVIAENNSSSQEIFEYYNTVDARVETLVTDWNFSHIMNEGMKFCQGEYVILLNNDTEVNEPDWIQQMLHFALREKVGAVGAKLLFEDGTIQHAGVTFGIRGVAGHAFYGWAGDAAGYENRICLPQNVSCVTAACLMVRRSVFYKVGGFDEKLKVNYNDVDFCVKIIEAGYRIVYTPFAKLTHYESKTRGNDNLDEAKLQNQIKESIYFQKKWCRRIFEGDRYYNRNLSTDNDDFTIR